MATFVIYRIATQVGYVIGAPNQVVEGPWKSEEEAANAIVATKYLRKRLLSSKDDEDILRPYADECRVSKDSWYSTVEITAQGRYYRVTRARVTRFPRQGGRLR